MNRYINMIGFTALFIAGVGIAEAGNWQNNRYGECDQRAALPQLYRDAGSCPDWEDMRREYNASRDVASIPIYMPERYLVRADNGQRHEGRRNTAR